MIGIAQSGYSDTYHDYIVPTNVKESIDDISLYVNDDAFIWYGLLSGYVTSGKQQLTSGFGTYYYGTGKTKGTFACPGEQIPFGSYNEGKYNRTHYVFNQCLSGQLKVSESRTQYHRYIRKINCLTVPSKAMMAWDSAAINCYAFNDSGNKLTYLSFRHGGDFRSREVTPADAALSRGKTNILFMDCHVGDASYREMKCWPLPTIDNSHFVGRELFCIGFDVNK